MRQLLIIMALLLVPGVLGLGVSPAGVTLSESGTFSFRALSDVPVNVRAEGDLAQYVTFDETVVQPGEEITGRIDLPAALAPGAHQQYIVIATAGPQQDGFAGSAEVAASLLVQIPYPDEYLDATWDIARDQGTGASLVTITFQNLGSKAVTPVTRILVGEQAVPVLTQEIRPGEFGKYTASILPAAPGVYDAVLEARYADKVLTRTRTERFGLPGLEITSLAYNDERGAIKPVDVSGRVAWNRPLNISAEVYFDNDTTPVHTTSFLGQESFTERLYITTDRIPRAVRVVLMTEGQRAEAAADLGEQEQRPPWPTLIVTAIIALVILLLLLWRKTFKDKVTGNK